MTEATKELLVRDGSFNYIERESDSLPEKLGNLKTYWLIGRNTTGTVGGGNVTVNEHINQNGIQQDKDSKY